MSYTLNARPDAIRRRSRDLPALAVLLLIAAVVAGGEGAAAAAWVDGWYARAPHVAWTPPGAVFGMVWGVLYLLIAVAGWLLWRRRHEPGAPVAMAFYVTQFVVNALWTPVFFGGYPLVGVGALWAGLIVIVILDLLVAATVGLAWRHSRAAALLLVPYLLWILYASTLNWGDAVLITLG